MENTYKALGALVLSLSVMPIAMADPGGDKAARNYTIDVKGETLPTKMGDLEYPYTAADRGLSGECHIRLQVNNAGNTQTYDITSCSNAVFKRAAAEFAKSARFGPTEVNNEHKLVVSWQAD